jgi:hypothetical protein
VGVHAPLSPPDGTHAHRSRTRQPFVTFAALGLLATPTLAQDKAAKAAAQKPAAVPADVRARVVSKLQGATAEDVSASPIPACMK